MHLLLSINIFLLIWHRLLHSYLNCSLFVEEVDAIKDMMVIIYKIGFLLLAYFILFYVFIFLNICFLSN